METKGLRILCLVLAGLLWGCDTGGTTTGDASLGDSGAVADVVPPDATQPVADSGIEATPTDVAADAPAGPPDGFLDPVAKSALVIDLKGRINSQADMEGDMTASPAQGGFDATLDGKPVEVGETQLFYLYQYPDDPSVPAEKRGKEILVIQAYAVDPASTNAHIVYSIAQVAVPMEPLLALPPASSGLLAASPDLKAGVRIDEIYVREGDGAVLSKDCTVAVRDPSNAAGGIFLDWNKAPGFEPGGVLRAWANVALLTGHDELAAVLAPQLEEYQGRFCRCSMGAATLPCAQWAEEITKEGTELSCPVPPDLAASVAPDHVVFTLKGAIESDTAMNPMPAASSFDVVLAGAKHPMDYMVYVVRSTVASPLAPPFDQLSIVGLGGFKTLGGGRYTFDYLDAGIEVAGLVDLKAKGLKQTVLDDQHGFYATLYACEQVQQGQDFYGKFCVKAMSDETASPVLFNCNDANVTFAVGEPLELAGNLPMTADPVKLTEVFGEPAPCYCSKGEEYISCAAFPAAGEKESTVPEGQTHEQVIARHGRDVEKLEVLINEGMQLADSKKEDKDGVKVWPKSAQWIKKGKASLHALTPTHDAKERGVKCHKSPNTAYFGIDDPVPKKGDYDHKDPASDRNINFRLDGTLGVRIPGKVAVLDAAEKEDAAIKGTIAHEIQHDADHHKGEGYMETYRTEFRAFWISGKHDDKSATEGGETEEVGGHKIKFANARQAAICKILVQCYVQIAWGLDSKLRDLAQNMTRPQGLNFVNSPAVDDLYLELQKEKPSAGKVDKLCKSLSDEEKAAIKGPTMCAPWRELIETKWVQGKIKKGVLGKLATALDWEELNEIPKTAQVKQKKGKRPVRDLKEPPRVW